MCPQLVVAICQMPVELRCCHAGVMNIALHSHTMGRPGAAYVPAGRPLPVPSYSGIVNFPGHGGEVPLTVILRGYFYEKHQLEGDKTKLNFPISKCQPKICFCSSKLLNKRHMRKYVHAHWQIYLFVTKWYSARQVFNIAPQSLPCQNLHSK